MRVGQTSSNPVQNSEVAKGRSTGKPDAATTAKAKTGAGIDYAGGTDDVRADLSPKGKEFAKAKAAANDAPDIREEKIAELKRRIAAGSYNIDSAATADKMVDEHLKTSEMG